MASAPSWNRRAWLTGRGPAAPAVPISVLRAPTAAELTVARRAMACEFSLTFPAARSSVIPAACAALDEVERLESLLSVYLDDSAVSCLNRDAAQYPVPLEPEVYNLLRFAVGLSRATGGAFDPVSGALVKAWGFFRGPRRVPSGEARRAALAASGYRHLCFDPQERTIQFLRRGPEFNLGGVGKGFAVDGAIGILRRRYGIRRALMQAGQSSLFAAGAPPSEPRGWTIAIANPCNQAETIARVILRNRALGTSGADHQFFIHEGRRYGHILDPRTGWPAHRVLSATAIAPTAAEADALSTAFFVLGLEATREFLRARPHLAAVLVVPGKTQFASPQVIRLGEAHVEVLQ